MKENSGRPKRSWRERIMMFMYGRNGYDGLCKAIWLLCLVLIVVNLFAGSFIISFIELCLMIYAIFRMLSKNIYKRQRENTWYEKMVKKMKNFFILQKNKWRDRKTHVYYKCPHCKNTLRLPKVKGEHTVNCPCCHMKFDMKV